MNKSEFNHWWSDYSRRFPDTGRWMAELDGSVLAYWQEALSRVELADCLEVSRRIMSGDLEAIKAYDRENIPAIIRSHVANLKAEQSAKDGEARAAQLSEYEREKYLVRQPRSPVKGSSRETLCRIETLMASGISSQEARRQIEPDDESDERYNCLTCRDSGWVDVFSNLAIAALIRRTPFPQGAPARMSVRCTCARASKKEKVERYSPNRYCVYDDNPERLEEWIVRIQAADLERRRFKEFDEFNNR